MRKTKLSGIKFLFATLIMISISNISYSQDILKENEVDEGWYVFPENTITKSELLNILKEDSYFSVNDEFLIEELGEVFEDKSNQYKITHTCGGYIVENSQLIISEKDGFVEYASGKLDRTSDIDLGVNIGESEALDIVLAEIGDLNYAWLNQEAEDELKQDLEDNNATYYPAPKLIIFQIDSINLRLVYSIEITYFDSINMSQTYLVYIDPQNGYILKMKDIRVEGTYCTNGMVRTAYNGDRYDIETYTCDFCSDYELKDCRKIRTYLTQDARTVLVDSDNNWIDGNERPATTAHWIAGRAYKYFLNTFNYAGLGGYLLKIYAGMYNYYNASYIFTKSTNQISIGSDLNTSKTYSAIDIVSHEYTHGIIQHTSKLQYQGESGALNESFADIFATVIENHILGVSNANWEIGKDISTMRDMSNPNAYGQSDYYGDSYWINPNSSYDNGGVHYNSGVQNKWFYLLCNSIGMTKAARIAWVTNRTLTSTAKFKDVRNQSIISTEKLYGRCSDEYKAVIDSWVEVGVSFANSDCYCRSIYHILPRNINCTFQKNLVKDINDAKNVIIYPNISKDVVNIKLRKDIENVKFILYNELGLVVKSGDIINNNYTLDIKDIQSGTYFLNIISNSNVIKREKIIKIK